MPTDYKATMGVNMLKHEYVTDDGTILNLVLWDIAGQDLFERSRKAFYSSADGIVYVYDVTRQETFQAIKKWKDEIRTAIGDVGAELLVANKMDLELVVSSEDGKKLAEELRIVFIETSAKTAFHVDQAFKMLAEALLRQKK